MRDTRQDLQDWFQWVLKNSSGGLGYPASYCPKNMSMPKSSWRHNPTPIDFPRRLRAIDHVMQEATDDEYCVLYLKYCEPGTDEQKCEKYELSLDKYRRTHSQAIRSVEWALRVYERLGR